MDIIGPWSHLESENVKNSWEKTLTNMKKIINKLDNKEYNHVRSLAQDALADAFLGRTSSDTSRKLAREIELLTDKYDTTP